MTSKEGCKDFRHSAPSPMDRGEVAVDATFGSVGIFTAENASNPVMGLDDA